MRVNFRHLVPIGVFMLLHGGSLSLGSFSPLLVPHDALGSIIFFLLARDIAKSAWSVRSVILFLKHQACWASLGHGPILNRNSVGASTGALILQQPASATLWGCCSSFFFLVTGLSCSSTGGQLPFATVAWVAILQYIPCKFRTKKKKNML